MHRSIRKEREWEDYIRINKPSTFCPVKTKVLGKPNFRAIVKVQALIRGFIARRNMPRGPVWTLIFDFVSH